MWCCRLGHDSGLAKCKGFPVGCQANRCVMVLAQGMTDAFFLFHSLLLHCRGLGAATSRGSPYDL